jgi:GTPase SAR1 family protein
MELKRNEELTDASFVLVGNKIDIKDEFRNVSYNEGKEYADSMGIMFKEVSALSG